MSVSSEMTARHAATLAELAGIGTDMARVLQTEAQTGETSADRIRAVAQYPKVARAVRQCLALEARFAADAEKADREAAQAGAKDRDARRERRRRQVHEGVERILTERLDDEEELDAWLVDLETRLDDTVLEPEVLDGPYEDVLARICADLGLPLDDADDEAEDDDEAVEDDIAHTRRIAHSGHAGPPTELRGPDTG